MTYLIFSNESQCWLTNAVVAEWVPEVLLGSGHRRCWGPGCVDHVTLESLSNLSCVTVFSLRSTSQSSSFPTSSRYFKGLRSSLFGILFFKITGFSFCPGSSSRYICCDPRSQVSGGGIIKTQSQLLHEMILHGSLETNNTVNWIYKRFYCLFWKAPRKMNFFLIPKLTFYVQLQTKTFDVMVLK